MFTIGSGGIFVLITLGFEGFGWLALAAVFSGVIVGCY